MMIDAKKFAVIFIAAAPFAAAFGAHTRKV